MRVIVSMLTIAVLCLLPGGLNAGADQSQSSDKASNKPPELEKLKVRVMELEQSLSAEQRQRLNQPLRWDHWTDWTYFAGRRPGLPIKALSQGQRTHLEKVLQTALSATGYKKAETIRSLEKVLGDDPGLYFLAVYGEPKGETPWALRWAGHHVVFNWVVRDDRIVASTPQFLGANPARVEQGPMAGTRALGKVEDLARQLVQSLSDAQKQQAILSGRPPRDVLSERQVRIKPLEPKGIGFGQLNEQQQKLLKQLIQWYAQVQAPAIAKARLKKAERERKEIHFAWIGGTDKTDKHYYRIQGQSFVIEYENARPGTNHLHTVWRDFEGDFGRDVLLQHLQAHHQDGGQPNDSASPNPDR